MNETAKQSGLFIFTEIENKCTIKIGNMPVFNVDYVIKSQTHRQINSMRSKHCLKSCFYLKDALNHFSSLGISFKVAEKIKAALFGGRVIYIDEKSGDMFTGTEIIPKAFDPFFRPKFAKTTIIRYQQQKGKIVKKTNFKGARNASEHKNSNSPKRGLAD